MSTGNVLYLCLVLGAFACFSMALAYATHLTSKRD